MDIFIAFLLWIVFKSWHHNVYHIMALIKVKCRELRNAKVDLISLVGRGASRIPFRVQKKESEMKGLDLGHLFAVKKADVVPSVVALVVYKQSNETVNARVKQSIADAGFTTDTVLKSEDDDETVIYSQGSRADAVTVKVSDQTLVEVKNFPEFAGFIQDFVVKYDYHPDLYTATGALVTAINETVVKTDVNRATEIKALIAGYESYIAALTQLPVSVFKADEAVNKAVQPKDEDETLKELDKEDTKPFREVHDEAGNAVLPTAKTPVKQAPAVHDEAGNPVTPKTELVEDHPEKAVVQKEVPGMGGTGTSTTESSTIPAAEAAASVKGTTITQKSETESVLEALKAMGTQFATSLDQLSQRVESVVQTQTDQKNLIDGVVKKAETLENTLKTTTTAPPEPGDKIQMDTVTKKEDTDPRTGVFDTGMMSRTQRAAMRR